MGLFPTKVLVAVDGSAEAREAARVAAKLCAATGSELHVVHVAPLPGALVSPEARVWDPGTAERLEKIAERESRHVLDGLVQDVSGFGEVAGAHLRSGRPNAEVVALAEDLGAGLVAIGNRGRGPLRRTLLGSVSDSVVRHAHCPVLIVRAARGEKPFPGDGGVLAAVDGSREADRAGCVAEEICAATGAGLHVVYSPDFGSLVPYPGPFVGDDWQERLGRARRGALGMVQARATRLGTRVKAEPHLRPGRAEAEIVRLGEELDAGLIVVGNRGLGGIKRALLGSVSSGVARHAPCSVLVVRGTAREPGLGRSR